MNFKRFGSLLLAVGLILKATGCGLGSKGNADELWRVAQKQMADGQFAAADSTLNEVAKLREPTPLDWLLRAQVDMALNRIEEAFAALEKVPESDEGGAQARLQAGQLELRRNRAKFAEAYFLRALALDPKLVRARRELIFIYGFQLRRQELSAQFAEMSKLTPLTYDDIFLWCLSRGVDWEPTETGLWLEKFVEADSEDRESRVALAENRRRERRFEEALEILSNLPPTDAKALAVKARIGLDRNDESLARRLLAGAPTDDPELARIRARLAQIDREIDKAIDFYQLALKVEGDDRESLRGLGQCYGIKGETKLSEDYLERAKKYDKLATLVQRAAPGPNRSDMQLVLDLGQACETVGRYPEALAWYQLLLKKDPLDQKAQVGIFRVKQAINK